MENTIKMNCYPKNIVGAFLSEISNFITTKVLMFKRLMRSLSTFLTEISFLFFIKTYSNRK